MTRSPHVSDNYFSIHFLSPQPRYSRGIRYIQLTLYRTSTCEARTPRRVFHAGGKSNSFPRHHRGFLHRTTLWGQYAVAVAYDFNSAGTRSFARSQSSSDRNWITIFSDPAPAAKPIHEHTYTHVWSREKFTRFNSPPILAVDLVVRLVFLNIESVKSNLSDHPSVHSAAMHWWILRCLN